MLTTTTRRPAPGDTVILHFSHSDMKAVVLERGGRLQCKAGLFEHDAFLNADYGSRVAGRPPARNDPTPHAVLLRLTPELWTQTLRHRTQIIYMTDIAVVIQHLRLRPGAVVAEAGTGSGSLTHSLARAVAPTGRVYTFDFHKSRADEARKEFAAHGLGDVVVSGWCDVCRPGDGVAVPPALLAVDSKMAGMEAAPEDDPEEEADAPAAAAAATTKDEEPPAGYGLPRDAVDAVFLDVPAPWLAVPNVLHVLRAGGAVCSYSPCIEQTLKFCSALRRADEFLDLHTVEALTREYAPVFTEAAAGASGAADRDDTAEPAKRAARRERMQFMPRPDGKGHSAFLTFARRRQRAPEVAADPAGAGNAAPTE